MAQKFISTNLQKYAIGKQIDVSINGTAGEATTAADFFSVMDFAPQNAPEPMMIEDAQGNRSTNTYAVIGDRQFPFNFKGVTDVNKIGLFLYLVTGTDTAVQDGSTGAYTHTFEPLNNVILPKFTIFFDLGAEGYRRLKNCHISKLTVSITDSEASFAVEGLGTDEDTQPNVASTVATIGITDLEYISGSVALGGSVVEATLAGTPNLSAVKNGDVFVIPSSITGITNDEHFGRFTVVSADNTLKTIRYINNAITDNTLDETTLTTSTAASVQVVTTPSYPAPDNILLRRHSEVLDAVDEAGLSAAVARGLRNFTIEFNNNSAPIYEKVRSSSPLEIFAKNLTMAITFSQLMSAASAAKAEQFRDNTSLQRAWRFVMEDTSKLLGTSVTKSPKLQVTVPQAMGVATRVGMGGNDELTYDWTLSVSNEQSVEIVLQNEKASYV